jgi:hypothetical protein
LDAPPNILEIEEQNEDCIAAFPIMAMAWLNSIETKNRIKSGANAVKFQEQGNRNMVIN